jgi:hypothetical protein
VRHGSVDVLKLVGTVRRSLQADFGVPRSLAADGFPAAFSGGDVPTENRDQEGEEDMVRRPEPVILILAALGIMGCATPPVVPSTGEPIEVVVDNRKLDRFNVRIDNRRLGWAEALEVTTHEVSRPGVAGGRVVLCLIGLGSIKNACLAELLSVPRSTSRIEVIAWESPRRSRRTGELCHLDVVVYDGDENILVSMRCP